jgi:hypothetical protein
VHKQVAKCANRIISERQRAQFIVAASTKENKQQQQVSEVAAKFSAGFTTRQISLEQNRGRENFIMHSCCCSVLNELSHEHSFCPTPEIIIIIAKMYLFSSREVH